jgi:hypothetical protein
MHSFVFVKRAGHLRLVGRAVQDYPSWVATLDDGEHFRADFKSLSASKSQEQLGYYFAAVLPDVLAGLKEQGWDEIGHVEIAGTRVPLGVTTENTDRLLKTLYATSKGITEYVSKARMSRQEMSDFLEFVLGWAHQNGIAVRPAE